jgi:predicted RNase H-like nuclease (RuvC/YqgF family)
MEAGEKEMRQVFEDVTTNNVKTVVAYTKDTREILRKLEKKVEKLNELIRQYDKRFEEMKKQIVVLQTKLFAGGS